MIIKSINIISFGKLKNKKIDFSDNLNIIYGKNESGKTTVAAFIEAMLYSFPPRSDRTKYLPWDNSTAAGEITINHNGSQLSVYRKFAQTPKGDILEPNGIDLTSIIPLERESYRKSIYSPEGKSGYFGTTDYINSRIAASLTSSDEKMNISKAVKNLEKLRRSLNAGNKLKNLENTISGLEDEYSKTSLQLAHVADLMDQLAKKRTLLAEYEQNLINSEQACLNSSEQIDNLELEIKKQEEYINEFPVYDNNPPQKPSLSSSFIFYILCTIMLFLSFYFIRPIISPLALAPICIYLCLYFIRMYKYNRKKANFLKEVHCSTIDDFEKMSEDKESALLYYNSLLTKKADLTAHYSVKEANNKTELYKKILAVKNEIADLEKNSVTTCRDKSIIKEELVYNRNLYNELSKKINAVNCALRAFSYAEDVISTDFTPKVLKKAMEYLNLIAPKDGREILLSHDMTISIKDPVKEAFSSFSFGFREEAQLCVRLAWADFLYSDDLPLIIDDPFLGSDDERAEKITDLLNQIAATRQVIIFTNRKNSRFSQLKCNFIDITPSFDV